MIADTDNFGNGISAFQSSAAAAEIETSDRNVASMADGARRAVATNLSFASPITDPQFARLPDTVREQIARTLRSLSIIETSSNKTHAARVQAAHYHGQRGFSEASLLRKLSLYKNSGGDWTTLIDKAQAGPAYWEGGLDGRSLPPAFVEFWKKLCENNQRKTRPAYRELLRAWRTHEILDPATGKRTKLKAIPGYAEWPQADGIAGLPSGWSEANLFRRAPKKFELAAARHGKDKASEHTRKVFTTRAGLRVGQFYLFDDQEYDVHVNFPNAPRAMRPVGLNVLDLFSACCFAYGFKPVLIDDDGVKKKGLEKHMPFLLAHVLCNTGYRTDDVGTTLIVESGTATIRDEMAQRIADLTEGHVVVQKGAARSTPAMAGQFEGASKGNPRFKAALESFFNLVRNEMAALPGQSGLDRNHLPAEHYGRDRYNTKLLKAAADLPEHRRALMQFPFMDWTTFTEAAMAVYQQINTRTEHDLEGWEKCGHIIQDMLLDLPSDPSLPSLSSVKNSAVPISRAQWLAMAPEQQAALKPFIHSRARKLSPQEVWQAGATGLQRLGHHALPVLLGPDFGIERTVRGGYITIEDHELSPDPLRFPSVLPSPSGRGQGEGVPALLQDGQKFLCYLNPFDPTTLVLTDARGRYTGALHLQQTPTRADADAIKRQMAAAKKEEAQRLAPLQQRHLDQAKAKRDMHAHNAAVLKGKLITLEERTAAADLRDRVQATGKAALNDMLSGSDLPQSQISNPKSEMPEASMADGSELIDDVL